MNKTTFLKCIKRFTNASPIFTTNTVYLRNGKVLLGVRNIRYNELTGNARIDGKEYNFSEIIKISKT